MATIDLNSLPLNLQKKYHNATTAGLIARLDVDKRYKGEGFGEWLLVDALERLLDASDSVAFPLIVVDAKDGVAEFYEKFGFLTLLDEDNKLFITIDSVRKSFKD